MSKQDSITKEIARLKEQIKRLESIVESRDDEHILALPIKVADALESWIDINENPIQSFSVLCINDAQDNDGYYNYHIYGYVSEKNFNKLAIEFVFRTKQYIPYEKNNDYTLDDIVIGGNNEIRNGE